MIKFITIVIELAILIFICAPIAIQSFQDTVNILKQIKNEEGK